MSEKPLYLNLMWHMHQPFYKNPLTGIYELPWVRLHGIKDYYDMAAILNDYPEVHQTFNLVPSLIEQIMDYAEGRADDHFSALSRKQPADLTAAERVEIAKYFFMANYDNMVFPFSRYRELLEKRGYNPTDESLKWTNYTDNEIFDLQVWFNLAWFDPIFRESDTIVARLIKKGRGFTESEKVALLDFQCEVLGMILPEYRALSEKGTIEITTTPYYHPIMPLIYDTNIARVNMPEVNLPERFAHREDVEFQVKKAVDLHKKVFGRGPNGMWPSEGSVSEDILPIIKANGISWIATDEEILRESINMPGSLPESKLPGGLYKAYRLGGSGLSIVFRDHVLSDLIGFVYSKWDPVDAANNFIARLHGIRDHFKQFDGNFMVSVILDGENAWEFYRNDGRDFLCALYERLRDDRFIQSVTVSEFLKKDKNPPKLKRLFPGSWINHNFGIWIGHDEDNKAWNLLGKARNALVEFEKAHPDHENLKAAWNEIYISEGSDWNWWYGDDHSSGIDELFDKLYRTHLSNVYRLLGLDIPDSLHKSILTGTKRSLQPKVEPAYSMTPVIDGINTSYFEWISAGIYEFGGAGDAMHRVTKIFSRLYYGNDDEKIYFRADAECPFLPAEDSKNSHQIEFTFIGEVKLKIFINILSSGKVSLQLDTIGKEKAHKGVEAAVADLVELAVPRDLLLADGRAGGKLEMFLKFYVNDIEMERVPKTEPMVIDIDEVGADALRWFV